MTSVIESFQSGRRAMNDRILEADNLVMKRFFSLDSAAYREGALPVWTKELLGLVASTVLRCDDCILYHLIRCVEEGLADPEIHEALSIALVVGGSITIPHLRRAFANLESIRSEFDRHGHQG